MDYCLTGADTLEAVIDIRLQLNVLLQKTCTQLRKRKTNLPHLLSTIPEDLQEKDTLLLITTPAECQEVLGAYWDTEHDTVHISTPAVVSIASPTKRQIASDTASKLVQSLVRTYFSSYLIGNTFYFFSLDAYAIVKFLPNPSKTNKK